MTGTICGPPSVHLPYTAHRHTGVSARSVHGTLLCHYCRQCQMHLRHATLFHWITVARRVYAFSLPLCIRRNVEHGMGVNHSPPWKSQIAYLDMRHLVFGINFQIHSVSLTILVSIHLLIHFSTHLCHHPHSRHPSLLHSFTPSSKLTFSTNASHCRFL